MKIDLYENEYNFYNDKVVIDAVMIKKLYSRCVRKNILTDNNLEYDWEKCKEQYKGISECLDDIEALNDYMNEYSRMLRNSDLVETKNNIGDEIVEIKKLYLSNLCVYTNYIIKYFEEAGEINEDNEKIVENFIDSILWILERNVPICWSNSFVLKKQDEIRKKEFKYKLLGKNPVAYKYEIELHIMYDKWNELPYEYKEKNVFAFLYYSLKSIKGILKNKIFRYDKLLLVETKLLKSVLNTLIHLERKVLLDNYINMLNIISQLKEKSTSLYSKILKRKENRNQNSSYNEKHNFEMTSNCMYIYTINVGNKKFKDDEYKELLIEVDKILRECEIKSWNSKFKIGASGCFALMKKKYKKERKEKIYVVTSKITDSKEICDKLQKINGKEEYSGIEESLKEKEIINKIYNKWKNIEYVKASEGIASNQYQDKARRILKYVLLDLKYQKNPSESIRKIKSHFSCCERKFLADTLSNRDVSMGRKNIERISMYIKYAPCDDCSEEIQRVKIDKRIKIDTNYLFVDGSHQKS